MSFKFLGFVEDIFLHEIAKFHMKTIMRQKVMKVYTKSLKNATNKHVKRLRRRSAELVSGISLEAKTGNALVAHSSPYTIGL